MNHLDWPEGLQEGRHSVSELRPAAPDGQAVDRSVHHRHGADDWLTALVDASPRPLARSPSELTTGTVRHRWLRCP
jgi:hypothetical protein